MWAWALITLISSFGKVEVLQLGLMWPKLGALYPPHERRHDPRMAQVAAGGRFVLALQASLFVMAKQA
jgi:hypothetical protein